jgi:hypothetical protein
MSVRCHSVHEAGTETAEHSRSTCSSASGAMGGTPDLHASLLAERHPRRREMTIHGPSATPWGSPRRFGPTNRSGRALRTRRLSGDASIAFFLSVSCDTPLTRSCPRRPEGSPAEPASQLMLACIARLRLSNSKSHARVWVLPLLLPVVHQYGWGQKAQFRDTYLSRAPSPDCYCGTRSLFIMLACQASLVRSGVFGWPIRHGFSD